MTGARRIGRVDGLFTSAPDGRGHDIITRATSLLTLDLAGILGERHGGPSRKAGAREPWLPRGAVLRNDRQVSALCPDELAAIATKLDIRELLPEWLGGNLLIAGLEGFSCLAPGSRLAFGGQWSGKGRFDGGAVLRVEAYNFPCRQAGRAVADATGRADLEFAFVKEAAALRGLVLSVDLAGPIMMGDPVVLLPPIVPKERAA